MIVTIEFFGVLHTLTATKKCTIELEEKTTISALIRELKSVLFANKEIINESNLLIVVNGKEMGVLNGLQTELKNSDVVKLIPASHGG